jgi:DNA-binding FrmR family transcriptional regulator
VVDDASSKADEGKDFSPAAPEQDYCIDILTQISAVNTALEALAFKILDEHVRHCVGGALSSGDEADAQTKTEELLEAVQRFARTR